MNLGRGKKNKKWGHGTTKRYCTNIFETYIWQVPICCRTRKKHERNETLQLDVQTGGRLLPPLLQQWPAFSVIKSLRFFLSATRQILIVPPAAAAMLLTWLTCARLWSHSELRKRSCIIDLHIFAGVVFLGKRLLMMMLMVRMMMMSIRCFLFLFC